MDNIAYTEFSKRSGGPVNVCKVYVMKFDMQVIYKLHIVYCVIDNDECTLCVILCIVSLLT